MAMLRDENSANNEFLTLSSANINGIDNCLPQISNLIQDHKIDVLMMQETHRINQPALQAWLNQSKFTLFANAPSVNEALPHFKSGIAILLHNRTDFVLQPTVQSIIPYRGQAIKFCVHSVTYLLINVYMPSGKSSRRRTQRDQMFVAIQNYIENESFDYLFVVGDFNVTLSRPDSSSSPVKSVAYFSLKTLLQQNNLKDSFRIFNSQSKIFSYIRSNAVSRLDRIYIPALYNTN